MSVLPTRTTAVHKRPVPILKGPSLVRVMQDITEMASLVLVRIRIFRKSRIFTVCRYQ